MRVGHVVVKAYICGLCVITETRACRKSKITTTSQKYNAACITHDVANNQQPWGKRCTWSRRTSCILNRYQAFPSELQSRNLRRDSRSLDTCYIQPSLVRRCAIIIINYINCQYPAY